MRLVHHVSAPSQAKAVAVRGSKRLPLDDLATPDHDDKSISVLAAHTMLYVRDVLLID